MSRSQPQDAPEGVAEIAHDLNNALTLILGNAALVRSTITPGSAEYAHVEAILEAARKASALSNRLLEISSEET